MKISIRLLTFAEKIYIIIFVVKLLCYVRLAQLDRAFGYGPKGRGFESSNAREFVSGGNVCKEAFLSILFECFSI